MRTDFLERSSQVMLLIAGATFFVALVIFIWSRLSPEQAQIAFWENLRQFQQQELFAVYEKDQPLVGIVVGHSGYDPGAVCDDGLTEVELNQQISQVVVRALNSQGIRTDLLEEFDQRLTQYQADALVSIHADSCTVPGATGFKVARVTLSAIPEAEDRLVECLINEYGKVTGLPEHSASITDGMTDYHAFREIDPFTPGAIIETGFMHDDRQILEENPGLVGRGVAAGILCFLKSTENG